MPKPAAFSSEDEDEKTTIESGGWEEEASTTVEQGEVADKLRALGLGGSGATPRPTTSITGSVSDEPTIDDQRAAAVLARLPKQELARLVVTQGNDAGQAIEVRPGKMYTVGRGIDNDLVLTDIAVSRKHFDIRADNGAWVLTDRGSGNGTLVNNRLEDAPFMLASGDVIEVGNTTFRFDLPNGVPRAPQAYDGGDDDLELSTVSGKPLHETAAAGADDPPRPPPMLPIPPTPAVLPAPPMVARSHGLAHGSERGVERHSNGAPMVIPPPGPTQPLARPKTLPPPSPRPRTQSTRPPFPAPRPPTQPPPLPPARMTGGMQAQLPPPGLGANLPLPLGSQPLPVTAGPTTIPGQGVMMQPPPGHPARLPFSYPAASANSSGVYHPGAGNNGRPSQSALGQPLGPMGPPLNAAMTQPLPGRPARLTGQMNGQMNGQMPHGQMPNGQMRPSMQIASGMPSREAPSTALVQPIGYGSNAAPALAPPHTFAPPNPLSRKVKLAVGGVGLALFAALATIAIIRATSHDGEAEPEPATTKPATVEPIATPVVAPRPAPVAPKPAPRVTPIAPTTAQAPAPVVTKPVQPQVAPAPPPAPTPPPTQVATKEPVVTPPPPPAPTPPPPTHTVNTAAKKPDPKPEPKPEPRPRAVEQRVERAVERPEPRPEPRKRGRSAGDVKGEAAARYRAKDFAGASQAISSQLSSLDAADASELKSLANIYLQLGRAYNVGMAPGTKPTEAYAALSRAISLDRDAGGSYVGELEEHQAQVAPRAATSFMAAKEYEAAFQAVRVAENLGSTSSSNKTIRGMLEGVANDLFRDAQGSMSADPDGAKKKLRTVIAILDAKNPLRSRAQRLLNSGG